MFFDGENAGDDLIGAVLMTGQKAAAGIRVSVVTLCDNALYMIGGDP